MDRKFPVTLPEGYIDFYKSLETWQNEQEIKLKKNPQPEKIDISKILASSKPVINTLKPQIDTQQFKTMYNELLALIKDQRNDIADKIDQISARVEELDFDEITRKLVNNDQHTCGVGCTPGSSPLSYFMFSFDHAYRPFIRVLAVLITRDIANDELRSWQLSGICRSVAARLISAACVLPTAAVSCSVTVALPNGSRGIYTVYIAAMMNRGPSIISALKMTAPTKYIPATNARVISRHMTNGKLAATPLTFLSPTWRPSTWTCWPRKEATIPMTTTRIN
jgi:hypothetical protein